jgi:hypothetical protein
MQSDEAEHVHGMLMADVDSAGTPINIPSRAVKTLKQAMHAIKQATRLFVNVRRIS